MPVQPKDSPKETPEPIQSTSDPVASTTASGTHVTEPILRVAKPYIPCIEIFGVTYPLRHPLENTAETKKRITELSNKYLAMLELVRADGAEVSEGQRKQMYEDMGRMINIFVPGVSSGDMALLDEHDRYNIVAACYAAYEDVYARMARREAVQEPPAPMTAYVDSLGKPPRE